MPVDLKEVESSNIAKVGYDDETEKLYVKFKSGAIWSYSPVPAEKFTEMSEAKSIGKFFAREIRPNKAYTAAEIVEGLEEAHEE